MMEKKPSENIAELLDFLEFSEREYEAAYTEVGEEDCRVQTFLHDMEFAENKAERNRVATKLQQSRRKRRKAKDKVQLYENVHKFYTDKQNAQLLKAMRRLLTEQNTVEKYLFGKREFKNRVE